MSDLFERARARDAEALTHLVSGYETRVRLYAAKVAPRPDMAEDVAQKAFLIALRQIETFDPSGDFGLWMHGIVRNVARQEWERMATRSRVERDGLAKYLEQLASASDTEAVPDDRWMDALRGCMEKLPDKAREMVRLRYVMGMSCRDISKRVGTSVDAAKMALMRIRGLLRGCVKSRMAEA